MLSLNKTLNINEIFSNIIIYSDKKITVRSLGNKYTGIIINNISAESLIYNINITLNCKNDLSLSEDDQLSSPKLILKNGKNNFFIDCRNHQKLQMIIGSTNLPKGKSFDINEIEFIKMPQKSYIYTLSNYEINIASLKMINLVEKNIFEIRKKIDYILMKKVSTNKINIVDTKSVKMPLKKLIKKYIPVEQRKNILLVIDEPGWCFDNIAQTIEKYYENYYNIYIEECTCNIDYLLEYEGIQFDMIIKFWYGYDKHDPFKIYPNAKKILCIYDYIYWNDDIIKNINTFFYRNFVKNINNVDAILVSCPMIEKLLLQKFGEFIPEKIILPAYDCVDLDKFYYQDYNPGDKLIVGWVGNIFNVFKNYGKLNNLIKNIDWIDFRTQEKRNYIPHDLMPKFYHSVDVIICFSDAEGTPNPILEASACGRAWISTDVGIVRLLNDALDSHIKPGFIINKHEELIEKLRYLHQNRNIMNQMGIIGRKSVEKEFSEQRCIDQFNNIFSLINH